MAKLLTVASCGAALVGAVGTAPQAYNQWDLAAVRRPPLEFVMDLAHAAIPAGIEIRAADRSNERYGDLSEVPPATADRGQLARLFNQHHSTYHAQLIDGVVVVRPSQDATPYLGQTLAPDVVLRERGLMRTIERIFSVLDPRLSAAGPRVGSVLGPVGVDVDRGENLAVEIDARGRSLIQVLDDLARAAPGHAWLVVTDGQTPAHIIRAGLIHQYRTTTEEPVSTALQRP